MLGAISGDVIGSIHEYAATKTTDFELFPPECFFTDDSVLTIAVAECLMSGRPYIDSFHDYVAAYPLVGWGANFHAWARRRDRAPYDSWGNGSAMRVAPVAYAFERLEEVLEEAAQTAEVTHNHPEGVKGAQATAAAVFLARRGETKPAIKTRIEKMFGYDLSRTLAVRPIATTSRVEARCRRRSSPFSNPSISKTRFESRSRSAATRTRWRASLAPSRKRFTAACLTPSPCRRSRVSTTVSAAS